MPQEVGGVGGNFFSVILLVEELAKVDTLVIVHSVTSRWWLCTW